MGRPASHIKRPPRVVAPPVLGSIPSAHDALRSRILTVTKRGRFSLAQIAGALGVSVGDQASYLAIAYSVETLPSGYRHARIREPLREAATHIF